MIIIIAYTNYETKEILIHENIAIASVLECKLETGRTHQIRVHLSEHGCRIIGDNVYGRSPRKKVSSLSKTSKECIEQLPGQALHAKTLGFIHPRKEKNVIFETSTDTEVIPHLLSISMKKADNFFNA